jgi:hypothetical protein
MAILKFRVYWEEDDAIYRDVLIKHAQNFQHLHEIILKAFGFDQLHAATFYRSNDVWKRGREISKALYDKEYVVPPLMMNETMIGSEIMDTNQHFIYVYDFDKNWTFLIVLIQVVKNVDADMTLEYPVIARTEGVGPMQYGAKGLLGKNFADIEEKYDLSETKDGFGIAHENDALTSDEDHDETNADEEDEEDDDEQDDEQDNKDDNGSGFLADSFEAY